ncbi:thioredoxin-like protein [Gonapodya prolifera JEL478]|uniref:Thioredoxin-like protein n=1 Tax=Gonapodya prolifera (strain JEL478) TaxID=1344416 RepID=A0A139A6L3_GONPJ|nr:thioredoxin-like protein [Gonapodya prolifera JEL478]|eukprot:KXS12452.1 thioredoxin-like protein [Gonapodya prolifera JEL478]
MATEWEDVLRDKGILPEVTESQIIDMMEETIASKTAGKSYEDKTLDELDDELDDVGDEDEERILQVMRQKRMEEVRAAQAKEKYGDVYPISKPEFVREVTEASQECAVVCLLYKDVVPESKLVSSLLVTIARRYRAVKFVKIVAAQAVPNFPDRNVPTLLIYQSGDLLTQLVTLRTLGGMSTSSKDLERYLEKLGIIKIAPSNSKDTGGESDDEENEHRRRKLRVGYIARTANADGYDDDDIN